MNRIDARTQALSLVPAELATNDTKGLERVNNCLKLAYRQFAAEAPYALFPDDEHLTLYADTTSTVMGRTLSTTADRYVLAFAVGIPAPVAGTVPVVDGTWDGIMHLEIKDGDGRWHRRQARSFWEVNLGGVPATYSYYVALDRPWRNVVESSMAFRIYQPSAWMSDDVMQVLDGEIWDEQRQHMVPLPERYFRFNGERDYQGDSNARPTSVARGSHFQLDAPNYPPQVASTGEGGAAWLGPEPQGQFEYAFTYGWGRRDPERGMRGGPDLLFPSWESSLSPASAKISSGALGIVVTLPEIEWQVNFNVAGALRAGKSGLYKRLYRRRNTVTGGTHQTIERPAIWQFLVDVEGETTTYTDQGVVVPDYFLRARDISGFYAWTPHPHQDARYELDFRVLRRPRDLTNDYDAYRYAPEYDPAFLQFCLHQLLLKDNDREQATMALAEGRRLAQEFKGQYGTPAAVVPSEPWGVRTPRQTPYYGRMTSS